MTLICWGQLHPRNMTFHHGGCSFLTTTRLRSNSKDFVKIFGELQIPIATVHQGGGKETSIRSRKLQGQQFSPIPQIRQQPCPLIRRVRRIVQQNQKTSRSTARMIKSLPQAYKNPREEKRRESRPSSAIALQPLRSSADAFAMVAHVEMSCGL